MTLALQRIQLWPWGRGQVWKFVIMCQNLFISRGLVWGVCCSECKWGNQGSSTRWGRHTGQGGGRQGWGRHTGWQTWRHGRWHTRRTRSWCSRDTGGSWYYWYTGWFSWVRCRPGADRGSGLFCSVGHGRRIRRRVRWGSSDTGWSSTSLPDKILPNLDSRSKLCCHGQ